MKNYMKKSVHIPVLLDATLTEMTPTKGDNYLDLTAGYGGHARAFLCITQNYKESVLVDRDENAIITLSDIKEQGVEILHMDFLSAAQHLVKNGRKFDLILADLGVSSPQLDIAERGFSFQKEGPLDMRMDPEQDKTAETIVNHANKNEIIRILVEYGEEKRGFAGRIADEIIRERKINRITTTKQLADLVLSVHKGRWQKTHPATRTFQAIRIAVNDELGQVEEMLKLLPLLTKPSGRVGIITFHSLEDRIVKNYFKKDSLSGLESKFEILTKKPLSGAINDANNPRSRSAKLRVSNRK
ncbi:16S rRNA (cytosine(1402)-N(4))-methyltransferase RsmH [Candidatus Saccharibacteria bacterium]|jgi:16S rRNA (cytosine1402-N4)-methyltransferase|nr:16S rRNA (cytosine(1402)-N(4))-methyltransferase RsmH [Candidatus Saccharibacteria bacterium]MBP9489730.1 16S rRNA (cytosine(1402)-N(4))-methyltransferase RsmH [Candidatus Saccharibacteria bacterium]